MLKFRQDEASKCILVKISDIKYISDLENFCKCYVNIENIFPYYSANYNVSRHLKFLFHRSLFKHYSTQFNELYI